MQFLVERVKPFEIPGVRCLALPVEIIAQALHDLSRAAFCRPPDGRRFQGNAHELGCLDLVEAQPGNESAGLRVNLHQAFVGEAVDGIADRRA